MSRATITMEDTEDGQLNVVSCYEDGFKVESNAHQCCLLLMKHMNTIGEPKGEEIVWGDAPSARGIPPLAPADAQVAPEEEHRVA